MPYYSVREQPLSNEVTIYVLNLLDENVLLASTVAVRAKDIEQDMILIGNIK